MVVARRLSNHETPANLELYKVLHNKLLIKIQLGVPNSLRECRCMVSLPNEIALLDSRNWFGVGFD